MINLGVENVKSIQKIVLTVENQSFHRALPMKHVIIMWNVFNVLIVINHWIMRNYSVRIISNLIVSHVMINYSLNDVPNVDNLFHMIHDIRHLKINPIMNSVFYV